MVLSVRVPASVGVSTTCTATANAVCVAPCPVLTPCGHESTPTSPTSSSVTTIAIAIAIAVWSAAIRRVGERARRAPISSKTSTKLHVRFVRMCGGGSVPGQVYILVREWWRREVEWWVDEWCRMQSERGVASLRGRARKC